MAPDLPTFADQDARPGRLPGLGFACLLGALTLVGCDTAASGPERTEPWQKDEVALSRSQREVLVYRAERGQSLSFSIATKEGTLVGRLPLSGATLSLDPEALDHSRGTLTFDLSALSLAHTDVEAGEGAAPGDDPLLTQAARLWLGLGKLVSQSERSRARSSRFDIRLGRELSSHSVRGGQVLTAGGGLVRRVSGKVEGDLELLGREVTHVLGVEVDFVHSAAKGSQSPAETVVVHLSRAELVPLAEHDIQPRDERGAVVTEQVAALGRRSNLRAAVTGSLSFTRSAD
jgi:hypothetical protein